MTGNGKVAFFRTNRPNRQRGLAAVEATIVLPILLLLFLATGEVGRAMLQYNMLEKGIRDGARYLATNAIDDNTTLINITGAMATAAKNLAVYGNIAGTGSAILPDYTGADLSIDVPDAGHVTLIANYPFQPVLFNTLPTFGYGGSGIPLVFTMTASVTMPAMQH